MQQISIKICRFKVFNKKNKEIMVLNKENLMSTFSDKTSFEKIIYSFFKEKNIYNLDSSNKAIKMISCNKNDDSNYIKYEIIMEVGEYGQRRSVYNINNNKRERDLDKEEGVFLEYSVLIIIPKNIEAEQGIICFEKRGVNSYKTIFNEMFNNKFEDEDIKIEIKQLVNETEIQKVLQDLRSADLEYTVIKKSDDSSDKIPFDASKKTVKLVGISLKTIIEKISKNDSIIGCLEDDNLEKLTLIGKDDSIKPKNIDLLKMVMEKSDIEIDKEIISLYGNNNDLYREKLYEFMYNTSINFFKLVLE